MSILLLDRGLFKNAANWVTVSGPDVNNPPSVFYMSSQVPDGTMLVTNGLDKNWGGALVKYGRTVPILNGVMLPYIAFHLKVLLPGITVHNLGRLETDLKVCTQSRPDPNTKIKNIADFSTQWNGDAGNWQIDAAGGSWIDVPGAITPELIPDMWHSLDYRFWMDPAAKVFSVLSIQWDGQKFAIPANLQNVPFLSSNWEETANLQLQTEGFHPGSVEVQYDEGVLAWSDQAIGDLPQGLQKPEGIDTFLVFEARSDADDDTLSHAPIMSRCIPAAS